VDTLERPLSISGKETQMFVKVFEGLYGFIWEDYSQNNCNTYFIDSYKKVLIDPGHAHLFGHVERGLATLGITPRGIDIVLATHGHPDHIESVLLFKEPTKFTMDRKEYDYIIDLAGGYYKIPEPDFFLQPGELIFGDDRFEVIETPGHTPGSVCLYWPSNKALFTGDLVFQQGIGRTDLPGGSGPELKKSIEKIMNLDADYILSGHGGIVAGKEAVRENFRIIRDQWFRYL
jgi:glyoxylase-like metal-dependent hydrolase (beta-lactamase superfamily II)